MNISIIIASYNRKDVLKDCLLSLFVQTYPKDKYEIIVVDDGSTDGTSEMVLGLKFKNLHYFYQENKGQPTAMNLGIKHAKGKIIAFTDDDCVASKDWLVQLEKGLKKNKNIAGVGGEIRAFNPQNLIEKYWDICNLNQKIAIEDRKDKPPFFFGANCAYRAGIFKKIGLFDPSLKFQEQDLDFDWRLYFSGYHLLYIPKAIVFHRMPKTFWQFLKKNFKSGRAQFDILARYQKMLEKKKNYKPLINVRNLLISDFVTLFQWHTKMLGSSKSITPSKYEKEKLLVILLPFLNSLNYRSLRLGMLYQALTSKFKK